MNNFLIAMTLGLMLSSVSFAEESKDSAGNTHEAMPADHKDTKDHGARHDEAKPSEEMGSDLKDQAAAHHDKAKPKKKKGGHRKGHHHKKSKHTHKGGEHHGTHGDKAVEGDAKKAEHAAEPMHHEASPEKKD